MNSFPRAFLFDHDGVLASSEILHQKAWREVFLEVELEFSEEKFRGLIGKTAPEILELFLNEQKPGWKSHEYDLNEIAKRKNDLYLVSAHHALRTYPGVKESLEYIKSKGSKLCVVSNAKRRELREGLSIMKLDHYFDEILSRDDVPAPKPDPRAYLFGAEVVGVDPKDCLCIEDSPHGMASAIQGKIPAVGILTNYSESHFHTLKPLKLFPSMLEFYEWIKTWPTK